MVGLDEEDAQHGIVHRTMVHVDVADAARNLAADAQQCVTLDDVAVADDDVFARGVQTPCVAVAARLDDHSVVALIERAILDEEIARHLQVDAVIVVSMGPYVQVAGDAVVAQVDVNRPERTFANAESVE